MFFLVRHGRVSSVAEIEDAIEKLRRTIQVLNLNG